MRLTVIAVLLLSVAACSFAQEDTMWVRRYGDAQPTMGRGVATSGTDIYTAGSVEDMGEHMLLVKYDATGETLWSRVYEIGDAEFTRAIRVGADGLPVIVARLEGDPQATLLVKVDASGDTVWTRTREGMEPSGLAIGSDNAVYAWVSSTHPAPFDTVMLMKYAGSGAPVWERGYHLGEMNRSAGCCVADDGSIYAAATIDNGGQISQVVFKFTPGGDTSWMRAYDELIQSEILGLAPGPDGGVYVAAMAGPMLKVMRCGSDGEVAWVRESEVMVGPEDYCNLASDSLGNVSFPAVDGAGIGVRVLDRDGVDLWLGLTDLRGEVPAIAVDGEGHRLLVGTLMEGQPMCATFKFSWAPGVSEPGGVTPAPVSPVVCETRLLGSDRILRLLVHEPGTYRVRLLDSVGRLAEEFHAGNLTAGRHELRVGELPAGTYLLELTGPTGTVSEKIIELR